MIHSELAAVAEVVAPQGDQDGSLVLLEVGYTVLNWRGPNSLAFEAR